jgi:hypothetical protein
LLFVDSGFDHLPELAAPLAREWKALVPQWRAMSVRLGQLLVEFRRVGVLPDLAPTTVAEFGVRHGLSAAEARGLVDVGLAVERLPVIASDVASGGMSVQAAAQVGRAAKNPALLTRMPLAPPGGPKVAPEVALEGFRQAALTLPVHEVRALVDRRIEEVKTGRVTEPMTIQAARDEREVFRRARDVASRRAGEMLPEGVALKVVSSHYLDDFDEMRVKPGTRRMASTEGSPEAIAGWIAGRSRTRRVPAEVRRQVLARKKGRCQYPGCTNRVWIQMAHRVPFALGGSQEVGNTLGYCLVHHDAYDRGDFTVTGTTENPIFWDKFGRQILPNGTRGPPPRGPPNRRSPPS